jgi:hypothetical protein
LQGCIRKYQSLLLGLIFDDGNFGLKVFIGEGSGLATLSSRGSEKGL